MKASPVPFTDNHMHLDPGKGLGLEAVKRFKRSGGRRIFLVCKTTRDWGLEGHRDAFQELYSRTIRLAGEVEKRAGVTAYPVVGVHPVEVVWMCRSLSAEEAVAIAQKALERAGEHVSEGEAAAIGEVGRPHFEVTDEEARVCEEVLRHAFEVAAEVECSLQIHASGGGDLFRDLRDHARRVGMTPQRVIKHFSEPRIREAEEAGVYPSVIASRDNVALALDEGKRFLMESDYIDDLRRPGAVVGPRSVPRVCQRLLEEGLLEEEDLWRIHQDNLEEAYGIPLDPD
jgi:TatD-related deoxyribonuclease